MCIVKAMTVFQKFTFHYVSIKSNINKIYSVIESRFTFHYVSIKSIFDEFINAYYKYLHSTMYLLNPSDKANAIGVALIYIPLCIY